MKKACPACGAIDCQAHRSRAWAGRGSTRAWRNTRNHVIQRDGLVCAICHQAVPPGDVHIDHVTPRHHGGTDELGNLRVTHSRCNLGKADLPAA